MAEEEGRKSDMSAPPVQVQPIQYVSFTADVNPFTTQALLGVCAQLANSGVKTVYLMLSTPGGLVREGMTLYNGLRAMPFELITHNIGNVDSIGNVIFLAGAKRYACPNATFMFHGVGFNVEQKVRLEAKDVREYLSGIQADTARMAAIIRRHTRFPNKREIAKLFLEARTEDARYAKRRGIIHDIRDVKIPPGAPVHQLVFQR
jgi:ATP-dependent Clp protease protease subunit